MCALHFKTFGTPGIAALNHKERVAKYPISANRTSADDRFHLYGKPT